MPFFTELQTIVSNRVDTNNNSGGLNRNNTNSRYNTRTLQFPLDIGAADKGHYILFNINEQKQTQYSNASLNDTPTVVTNILDLQKSRGSTNLAQNTFGVAGKGPELLGTILSGVGLVGTGALVSNFARAITENKAAAGFLRTIKRSNDSIVLYMPDKISYSNGQTYQELKLGGSATSLTGMSALAAMSGAENLATFTAFAASQGAGALAGALAKQLKLPEGTLPVDRKEIDAIITAVSGVVKNPMLEVIYQGVKLRTFSFGFSLWPRSEQEAFEVQKIIEMLRFHQAPEIKKNSGGFFLIPPSEFDISFMYNGKVNPNIDAISTCVLTNIAVDYTPKGFHAFESIGSIDYPEIGKTGMPVGIGLTLSFMETQILTKDNYKNSLINSSNNSFP